MLKVCLLWLLPAHACSPSSCSGPLSSLGLYSFSPPLTGLLQGFARRKLGSTLDSWSQETGSQEREGETDRERLTLRGKERKKENLTKRDRKGERERKVEIELERETDKETKRERRAEYVRHRQPGRQTARKKVRHTSKHREETDPGIGEEGKCVARTSFAHPPQGSLSSLPHNP